MSSITELRRILVPRFDTIGDIILLEGFLEKFLSKHPAAEITMAVQESYAQLKTLFPEQIKWLTTKVHPYKEPDVKELHVFLANLANEQWDLILTTTYNRTYIDDSIALKLNHVKNIAIGKPNDIPYWLKNIWTDLGISEEQLDYEFVPVEEFSHETEKYRKFWESLTGENTLPNPRLIIAEDLAKRANDVLSSLNLHNKDFCICNPAGTANVKIKAWPEERFAEVIARIENKYNLRTLLTGHEKENEVIERVIRLAQNKGANPLIWLGKDGDIPLLAAMTRKAKLYFGNDTGAMHIAAAMEIPVVGIFGGGTFLRFLPVGASSLSVVGDLPCFKCYWDCIFEDAPCLRLVNIDDVQKAIDILFSGKTTDSNILPSSYKVSDETSEFIEKAKNTFQSIKSQFSRSLETCEKDRAARLEIINSQAQTFREQLSKSEQDRASRLEVIQKQGKQIADLQKTISLHQNTLSEQHNKLLEYKEILKKACEEIYRTGGELQFLSTIFRTEKIVFGKEEASLFLHSGWGQDETFSDDGSTVNWAIGSSASLFLALPKDEVRLTVNVRSFELPKPQTITVRIDGKEMGKWTLSNKWQWEKHSVLLQPDNERKDVSIIEFAFSQKTTIDNRDLAVLFESLRIDR